MKTTSKTFVPGVAWLVLMLGIAVTQSCETEIPPEDSTPPGFSLRITGDGFDHTFDQDTNFNAIRLMLRLGATYDFIFSGSDQGGVDRIAWYIYHSGRIAFTPTTTGSWRIRNLDPTNSSVEWNGDPANPLTGSIISGSFTTQGSGNDANFGMAISDFGGQTGTPNRISEDLVVYIGAHNTRVASR